MPEPVKPAPQAAEAFTAPALVAPAPTAARDPVAQLKDLADVKQTES